MFLSLGCVKGAHDFFNIQLHSVECLLNGLSGYAMMRKAKLTDPYLNLNVSWR